jgi:hypothetical protein
LEQRHDFKHPLELWFGEVDTKGLKNLCFMAIQQVAESFQLQAPSSFWSGLPRDDSGAETL